MTTSPKRIRNGMPPIHPGSVLKELFLEPMGLSVNKLAIRMHVTATRMNEIVNGKRGISADTAMRLAKALGTSPEVWLNMQQTYELRVIETSDHKDIDSIEPFNMDEFAAA